MRVLAFNPGSNSLKFQIIDATADSWGKKLAWGAVDPIGGDAKLTATGEAGTLVDEPLQNGEVAGDEPSSHQGAAAAAVLKHIAKGDFRAAGIDRLESLDLIACRVVPMSGYPYDGAAGGTRAGTLHPVMPTRNGAA